MGVVAIRPYILSVNYGVAFCLMSIWFYHRLIKPVYIEINVKSGCSCDGNISIFAHYNKMVLVSFSLYGIK